ncbi:cell division septal protein FtsQ [Rhizobium sp. BK379]|nr:cell division septal protein FtsQ [Rhizobium sp. BK379]
MSREAFLGGPSRKRQVNQVTRAITIIRIFFLFALFSSGVIELWASNFFSTPIEQLTVSAIIGALGVFGAKVSHLV